MNDDTDAAIAATCEQITEICTGLSGLIDQHGGQLKVPALLGQIMFGENTLTPDGTRQTINLLRIALDHLEGHYARQIGDRNQARVDAAREQALKRQSADKPAAKRGRKPKGNGTPPEPAPSSLPFGPGPALEA